MAHRHHETGSTRRLAAVAVANLLGAAAEFAGGLAFGSVALLGDAVHMLFDALAYLSAFVAAYAAERIDAGEAWSFGFHRLEVVTAVVNGLLLIPMAGWILWEAYRRYLAPVAIDTGPTLAVAVFGLAVNVASVYYLRGGGELSLNERGAYLHLLGDAAGSVAVVGGLAVVHVTGIRVIDPVIAAVIAVMVAVSALSVLREGAAILLQRSPIDPADIRDAVEGVEGVASAHDVRSWRVCSRVNVCTVHAVVGVKTLAEAEAVRDRIETRLREEFGIDHVTLQVEQEASDTAIQH